LLDVKMPEPDGFKTMKKLHTMEQEIVDIPVIFLTADENAESESEGLSLGAMDFIKKPFVPDVLLLRVRHTIELITLQRNLSNEVERKTRENNELFIHVVQSLAEAIDAKDTYTNGHSSRVAEYSQEIAKRAGYSVKEQSDIYMMGLLHDVGKIGVPDAIINKPSRLTDEEFKLIKEHPEKGARILENIKEMPKLVTGARWHHERYGGGGYPDNLSGKCIPEEARIIAVADAYDAMTSKRSYRDVLSQEYVRGEIKKGIGTQFDPKFANIMLEMIDEDTQYRMREI
ncbi:MAG: HD domain-containing protein, partial [Ruminococcus sp.]|nr:HD domain-containing protein [Ruminococcus sp.]